MEILELILSAVLSLIILFFLTKLMGYRQISQMSFFDYVIGITIGSIAAEMATDLDLHLWQPILAMVIYALAALVLGIATQKSIKARRFIAGVPVILVQNGTIIPANLKKVHYDVNDLLADAREEGYFNIGDIQYAIMENTGKVSFLPSSDKRPVTPQDLNFKPQKEGLLANVVMDGKIMERQLKQVGKDEHWLKKELDNQHLTVEETFLAVVDENNTLTAYKKNVNKEGLDLFL